MRLALDIFQSGWLSLLSCTKQDSLNRIRLSVFACWQILKARLAVVTAPPSYPAFRQGISFNDIFLNIIKTNTCAPGRIRTHTAGSEDQNSIRWATGAIRKIVLAIQPDLFPQ